MTELGTSAVSRPRSSASICSTVRSIVSALMGRFVQATCRLRRSLSGLHSWRRWSLLTTISVEVSGRSYVVKRCEHFAHSLRRRVVEASAESRLSSTRVSGERHTGQRMAQS